MPDGEQYWLGHRERLREKARRVGIEALRPYEIVELILFQADPRADMSKLARALTVRFGTLKGLLSADMDQLMAVEGMSRNAANWIMRTGELLRQFLSFDGDTTLRIWRSRDLIDYIAPCRQEVRAPQTWMLYTDRDDRLMMCSVLCESLGWADAMIAQQILREAMSLKARCAYLVCFVGTAPMELTAHERAFLESLSITLRAVAVELVDVLMVGEMGFHSLNQAGEMDELRLAGMNQRMREEQSSDGANGKPGIKEDAHA